MCIAIFCKPGYDLMNFELNLIFLIKPIFLHEQNIRNKNVNILKKKGAFKMK